MDINFADSPVTLILLLVNVLVSGYALFSDETLLDRLGFRPTRIQEHGEWYRFITAGFVHVNLAHLAFNMITLYFFGPLLEHERVLGSANFIVLYFGSELAAHALTYKFHKGNEGYNAVGASGAISGVVFAFCLFAPFQKLYLFFALPIPAILFAVGFVAVSIYAMKKASGRLGGIAHEAHLGGAIGGVVLTILLEPRALDIFLHHFGL